MTGLAISLGVTTYMSELSILDQIRSNAELVVSTFSQTSDVALSFDETGVEWVNGYIERNRSSLDPAQIDGLVNTLGSFLGECIVREHGGQWAEADGQYGVQFDQHNWAFPFNKIRKHIENGAEDSILSYFTIIPAVFKLSPDGER